ncbi:hypothetical protein [uncultured Desulfovibrio sp.]|uniref:hypothetical protein n=1 Tax=uncultured Desulfovibrio sp. TaxID=167968 RepID=UPI00261DC877|nr:hypothetical protein [uncultured Desulfovibrio sp.]
MNTAGIEKTQAKTCVASAPQYPAMQATQARNVLHHYAAIIPYLLFNDAVTARISQ